ncbi:MAG: hypothetical protein AAFO29_09860 [Actinomycetota bacterium]
MKTKKKVGAGKKFLAMALVAATLCLTLVTPSSGGTRVYNYGDSPSRLCGDGNCDGRYDLMDWLTRHCVRGDRGHTWTLYGGAHRNSFYTDYQYRYKNPSNNRWVHVYKVRDVWSHDFSYGDSGSTYYGTIRRYC